MLRIEVPGFIKPETWAAFVELRRLKGSRAPLTEFAAKRIIGRLIEFDAQGYDADDVLATSVERGWCGVFLTAETPKRNPEVARTASYLAEIGTKGTRMPDEVRAKLRAIRAA